MRARPDYISNFPTLFYLGQIKESVREEVTHAREVVSHVLQGDVDNLPACDTVRHSTSQILIKTLVGCYWSDYCEIQGL